MSASQKLVEWSDLLLDILRLIARHLTSTWDFVRFRAVCLSWRSAANPADRPPQVPSLILPYIYEGTTRSFLDPSDRRVHTIDIPESREKWIYGTSHGWLGMIGEQVMDKHGWVFTVSLLHPITRAHILLPPLPCDICDVWDNCFQFVLSGRPDSPGNCQQIFLALLIDHTLAICRLGGGGQWIVIDSCSPRFFGNCIYFDGAFYVVDFLKGLTIINTDSDSNSLKWKYVPPSSVVESDDFMPLYLVESSGDLYLLENVWVDIDNRGRLFKLDRSNSEKCNWIRIRETIGDRALFVGIRSACTSLSSRDLLGCDGDLIYFANREINYPEESTTVCIFDIVAGRIIERQPSYWYGPVIDSKFGDNLNGRTWLTPTPC